MSLAPLIQDWWGSSSDPLKFLARNFLLDVDDPTIRKRHPSRRSHGKRLQPSDVAALSHEVNALRNEAWYAGKRLWEPKAIERCFDVLTLSFDNYNHSRMSARSSSFPHDTDLVHVARYIPLRNFCMFWLRKPIIPHDFPTAWPKISTELNLFPGGGTNLATTSPDFWNPHAMLGIGTVCWVTPRDPAHGFPHQDPAIAGLSPSQKAEAVIRRLALPGFDTPEKRLDAMGLIVAIYPISKQLLRTPDILDAGSTWYFFPGESGQPNGRTVPLDGSCNPSWIHQSGGYMEYVHPVLALKTLDIHLELVGQFDEALT
ncbi:MAG: hypothetical protein HQM03_08775 [Magnetococcales bacterium]|nr:hypothetical protein [Magnetococcales bacterium]